MHIQTFTDYKRRLCLELTGSEALRELLDTGGAAPLLYEHIFPYLWPGEELDAEVGPLLCFDVEVPEEDEPSPYLPHQLVLWLLCPQSLMALDPDGAETRLDAMAAAADGILSGSRHYGVGKLRLHAVEALSLPPNYCGKSLTYQASSFR